MNAEDINKMDLKELAEARQALTEEYSKAHRRIVNDKRTRILRIADTMPPDNPYADKDVEYCNSKKKEIEEKLALVCSRIRSINSFREAGLPTGYENTSLSDLILLEKDFTKKMIDSRNNLRRVRSAIRMALAKEQASKKIESMSPEELNALKVFIKSTESGESVDGVQ